MIFDLDDTLYKEIDFLKSGYRYIAQQIVTDIPSVTSIDVYNLLWASYQRGGNPFDDVISEYGLKLDDKSWMLNIYRSHIPLISLEKNVVMVLDELISHDVILGIISDGRQMTQMNKIKALGLTNYMDINDIIINESLDRMKPDEHSYRYFQEKYGKGYDYTYVGDNPAKDFYAPNMLGWKTICLMDDGRNIHKQNITGDESFMPDFWIEDLRMLLNYN